MHDARQRRRRGRREEGVAQPVDDRRGQDDGPADPVAPYAHRERGQHDRANAVAHDHGATTVESVRQCAGGQPDEERRERRDRRHRARDHRPMGEGEDEEGVGERAELGAEVREDLADPQEPEVAVVAKRHGRRRRCRLGGQLLVAISRRHHLSPRSCTRRRGTVRSCHVGTLDSTARSLSARAEGATCTRTRSGRRSTVSVERWPPTSRRSTTRSGRHPPSAAAGRCATSSRTWWRPRR